MMKTFKKFLSEQPFVDTSISKDSFSTQQFLNKKYLKDAIKNNNAEHLGDNHYHLKPKLGEDHYFFHTDKHGNPNEVSIVHRNVHVLVYKDKDGKTEHVYKNMENAVNKLGHLETDNSQSVGGVKLWARIHDHLPHLKLTHINEKGEKYNATADYLKGNYTKIWTKNPEDKTSKSILRLSNH